MNMAETLNLHCLCTTLEPQRLQEALEPVAAGIMASHANLFSGTSVFLGSGDAARITAAVRSLHRISQLPAYRAQALERAPEMARQGFGPQGAFMGYDFHLGATGPRLIEINTNAGGAFVHAAALGAHQACCDPAHHGTSGPQHRLEEAFTRMFKAEWQCQRGDLPLRNVAIVDTDPAGQFLAPEFELARRMFARHGIACVVTDPAELAWRDGSLYHTGLQAPVDLVYNRLTDFYLAEPRHAALRQAWQAGAVVLTPDPHAYALHADKRNLIALSQPALLRQWGAHAQDADLLAQVVPATESVSPEHADRLWAQRRQLFFKPATGFGSRAAYRGDKLTRRVWDEILAAPYVAQELVAPSERAIARDGVCTRLKVDVRAYAYAGQVLVLAARTYAGQTTNFRTPGGGFSPVTIVPDMDVTPAS